MVVLKFGGTSVASGPRIAAVARIAAARRREGCLVVVSALGGATDELLRAAELARRGEAEAAQALLERLRRRHAEALAGAGIPPGERAPLMSEVEASFARLAELLAGIALLRELTPRTSDALLSAGELLSSRIVAGALRGAGCEAVWCDPRDLMATSRDFGGAAPDEAAIAVNVEARVAPHLARGALAVTGGFVGREAGGETTTLGRGGSDYSASLLGAALGASAIEIWTDVDGLMTADPRAVPRARLVPEVSYAEAAELAFFGARVLHPATIRPAVARGIPVRIRNSLRPSSPGTVILREAAGEGVRALAARPGAAAILVSNPRMLLAEGYASRVFSVFERYRVSVDVIATSEVSISTTVDGRVPLGGVVEDLSRFSEVRVIPDLAVVSVVGRALRTTPGIAARAFAALGGINVVLISQGASETNLTFVVAQGDAPAALNCLHEAFFGEARPAAAALGAESGERA